MTLMELNRLEIKLTEIVKTVGGKKVEVFLENSMPVIRWDGKEIKEYSLEDSLEVFLWNFKHQLLNSIQKT